MAYLPQLSGLTGRKKFEELLLKNPYGVLGYRPEPAKPAVSDIGASAEDTGIDNPLLPVKFPDAINIGSEGGDGNNEGGDGITGGSPTGDENADTFGLGTQNMDTIGGLAKTIGGIAMNFSGKPTTPLGAALQVGTALVKPAYTALAAPVSGMIGLGVKGYNALGAANTVAGMGMTKGQAHSANRSTPGDDMTNIGMEIDNPELADRVAMARRGEYVWGKPAPGGEGGVDPSAPSGSPSVSPGGVFGAGKTTRGALELSAMADEAARGLEGLRGGPSGDAGSTGAADVGQADNDAGSQGAGFGGGFGPGDSDGDAGW